MAYKQSNNPFKKLHGDLQGFGRRIPNQVSNNNGGVSG